MNETISNAITRLGNVLAVMDGLTTSTRKDRLIVTGAENTIDEVIQSLVAYEKERKKEEHGENNS